MLRNLFVYLLCDEMGENLDYIYDWTTQNDLRKRKAESNNNNNNIDGLSTSVYQISEKKSIHKKESESILSVKRKNEIASNGNNYISYKSNNTNHLMICNNNYENNNKNRNHVFIESKDNDNKAASKCCLM